MEDNQTKDMLETMFTMQKDLNKRIGVDTDNFSQEEKIKWILNYCRALNQEVAELVDSVPWKWWAKYQNFNEQNAKVEIIDMFHFLISLSQVVGLEPKDVFEVYVRKNKVNHERQDTGYKVKDESDNFKIEA